MNGGERIASRGWLTRFVRELLGASDEATPMTDPKRVPAEAIETDRHWQRTQPDVPTHMRQITAWQAWVALALLAAILVVQGVLLWRLWSATAMAKSAAEDARELKAEVIKRWPR